MLDARSLRRFFARLGLVRPGFLTPYRYLDSVRWDVPDYPEVRALFEAARPDFKSFLDAIHGNEARFAATLAGTPQPSWESAFISPLDGAAIYTGVGHWRPARIVEIGSGNSTYFLARAALDHATGSQITCIDPAPRIDIAGLPVSFERRVLSTEDVALTAKLSAGDMLFVDSSHILQQGFDLDIILNRILPSLAPGVIVHFHDIFLPYGYPAAWEKFRFNEQNALIGWLLAGYLRPLFSSQFACLDMAEDLARVCPAFPRIAASGGASVWLRKV